jgi:hypothetical protein
MAVRSNVSPVGSTNEAMFRRGDSAAKKNRA